MEKALKPKVQRKSSATKTPKILKDSSSKKVGKKSTKATLTITSVNSTNLDETMSLPIIVNESHLNVDSMLSNPLLPLLPHSHNSDIDLSATVSNHLINYSSVEDNSHLYRMDLSTTDFPDPFSNFTSSLNNDVHHIHSPIASTSAHIFSHSQPEEQIQLQNSNSHFPSYHHTLPNDDASDPTIITVDHSPLHHLNQNHSHNHLLQQHHNQLIDVSLTLPPLPLPQLSIQHSQQQSQQQQQQSRPVNQIPLELLPLLPDSSSRLPLLNLTPSMNTTTTTSLNSNSNSNANSAPSILKRTGAPTTLETRAAKRIRNRSTNSGGVTGGLKTTWKRFLIALDPLGRLSSLINNLSNQTGGIDPGILVNWEGEEVKDFLERVAENVEMEVKIHFRVLLAADGKKIWSDMGGKIQST